MNQAVPQQHMNKLRNLMGGHIGCGNHSMWVWSLNHCAPWYWYHLLLLTYFSAYGLVKQLQIHKIMQYSTGIHVGISREKIVVRQS